MNCSMCQKQEHWSKSNGTVSYYEPGEKVVAMICGRCTCKLLAKKIGQIPWDGKLPEKRSDEPLVLKRRKGA